MVETDLKNLLNKSTTILRSRPMGSKKDWDKILNKGTRKVIKNIKITQA